MTAAPMPADAYARHLRQAEHIREAAVFRNYDTPDRTAIRQHALAMADHAHTTTGATA